MSNCIDYELFGLALAHYRSFMFKQVEVPWWVTSDIANITKPTGVPESSNYKLSVNGKCLIASGEQAFLYLANKGHLPFGKYQTVTPCFRNEAYDAYHSKQFMKLELIELLNPYAMPNSDVTVQEQVIALASAALSFFKERLHAVADRVQLVKTGVVDPIAVKGTEQLDIVLALKSGREIELGSYGARATSFATWIYGTGLAEPRCTKAYQEALSE